MSDIQFNNKGETTSLCVKYMYTRHESVTDYIVLLEIESMIIFRYKSVNAFITGSYLSVPRSTISGDNFELIV